MLAAILSKAKPNAQGAKLAFVALIVVLAAMPTSADEGYYLGGKQVPREFYDAGLLVNQGNALLHSNKNQEAADKLAQAIQIAPGMAEAHLDYALALAKLKKTDKALDELKLTLKINPNLDSAWLSLGGIYQSSGDIPAAVQAYHEFLTRFPNHQSAQEIAVLIQGLEKEAQRPAVPPAIGADGKPIDDYFANVTRGGVIRWPSARMPLRVLIRDGSAVTAYKPSYDRILRKSLEDWSHAANGLVMFKEVTALEAADIEISWLSDGRKLNNAAESGETRVTKNRLGIVHATVQLLTIPTLPEMPMTDNRMRQISLHEIGHALGLAGHTTSPSDAMFFSSTLDDQWKDLSPRDANTIVRLYSQAES